LKFSILGRPALRSESCKRSAATEATEAEQAYLASATADPAATVNVGGVLAGTDVCLIFF
jgi:hypothetical protein